MTEPDWADVRRRNDHTRAHLASDKPVRAGCPVIAPVCATCGHEIDKDQRGWFHVLYGPCGSNERDLNERDHVHAYEAQRDEEQGR